MRRRWLLALYAIAAAQQPHRESLRHREKRHARVLRELADHDRAQITEMHAQGLQPHHIAAELGLPGGEPREHIKPLTAAEQKLLRRILIEAGCLEGPVAKRA